MSNKEITMEEIKAFLDDAKEVRKEWLDMAQKSWREIKKQLSTGARTLQTESIKKKGRHASWYSIWRIRQAIVYSRLGVPVGKDTTLDGADPIGATAAICLERLAKNLAKTFPLFDILCTARDDLLITNFGTARVYYERDTIKEREKEYITPTPSLTNPNDVIFIDAAGKEVLTDEIFQDDEGMFIYKNKLVDVENERVCIEQVLYNKIYIDPDITRYHRCKRLAFELEYSEPEFKEIFGAAAMSVLPAPDESKNGTTAAAPKRRSIKVFEYWDLYANEVKWLPEDGSDFVKPQASSAPILEDELEEEERRGLYNLKGFFPIVKPMVINQSTDEFWPTPEYFQLIELIEEIHTIFSRIMALTRAIRARLLFDSNIEGLREALSEATDGDAFGVPNLSSALAGNGGTLEKVVQYIPLDGLLIAIEKAYIALEQRLNALYKQTGTSDLLQGLITDPTQRTLGERQMTEKYALNQVQDFQMAAQNFNRDAYQLMCETALQNFKQSSLDRYILPETLEPEHRKRYPQAIQMLKDDPERFRIELETDSTISINEQYDRQMAAELVKVLTESIERVASTTANAPALTIIELHALKHLIQNFRQGKLFQAEITQAIDAVIKEIQNRPPAPPSAETMAIQLKQKEIDINARLRAADIQSKERQVMTKLGLDAQISRVKSQLDAFKMQSEAVENKEQRMLEYEKLRADITIAMLNLQAEAQNIERELSVTAQDSTQRRALEAYKLNLTEKQQNLENMLAILSEKEKWQTEERLQAEHELQKARETVQIASDIARNKRETTELEHRMTMDVIDKTQGMNDQNTQ